MKRLLIFFIIAFTAIASQAAISGSITNGRSAAVTRGGESAIKITADYRVKGLKGKKMKICLWLYNYDGSNHTVYDEGNSRKSKYIELYKKVSYDSSLFEDYDIYITLSDFLPKSGMNDYYAVAAIYSPSNEIIAQSKPIYFSAYYDADSSSRKKDDTPVNNNNDNGKKKQERSETKTWTRTFKGDAYNRYTAYSDGTIRIEMVNPCRWCNATGLCPFCRGAGGTWGQYTNTFTPCYHCGPVRGSCMYCKGGKYETTIMFSYPNGKSAVVSSDGKVTTSDEAAARREVEKERRRLHDSGTCPNCHGTHCEASPMFRNDPSGAAAQAVGQIGHTNTQGYRCSICGQWDYHIHLKCHLCN